MQKIKALVSMLLAAPFAAQALTITTYSDLNTFTNTYNGFGGALGPTEFFDDLSFVSGVNLSATGGLFTTTAPSGSSALSTISSGVSIDASFSPKVSAFGSIVFSEGTLGDGSINLVGSTIEVTASDGNQVLVNAVPVSTSATVGEFFGVIVQDGSIDSVSWQASSGEFPGIDDLVFGTTSLDDPGTGGNGGNNGTIPLPGTLLLLGIGALAGAAVRRRSLS